MSDDELVEVRLLQLPVGAWGRAREHSEALQREFALIDAGRSTGSTDSSDTPQRLLEVIAAINTRYEGVGTPQRDLMWAAEAAGEPVIDELVYQVPRHTIEAVQALSDIFDEADVYCRTGTHLLTLETPPQALAYRRWFLSEFSRQINEERPLSWPDYVAANPIA